MAANTPTTLASRLKEQFNGDISQLVPGSAELVKLKFRRDIELGKSAIFDVQLSDELGFTVGQGEMTLNGNINQSAARATVDAYSLVLQSNVSYDLISRASSEKKAFAKFVDSKLRLVDKKGRLIDSEGRLIDESGRFVDENGNFIDKFGNRVDADGEYVVDQQPFLDDDGNPIQSEETPTNDSKIQSAETKQEPVAVEPEAKIDSTG